MILGGLSLKIRKVPAMEAIETILASVSSLGSKRSNSVQGTLTIRGVQHLEEEVPSPGRAMEVRYSVLEKTVLSVAMLIVESADTTLMFALVLVRADT